MPFPNKIKYSTTPTPGTIKADNFLIGVNSGTTYGPTSVTGFYQSLTPVTSGFTIHQNKATLGPSTFRPNNDSEFITLTRALGGNVTGVTDSIAYLNSQTDIVVINRDYEDIPTSGLSLCLDAGYTPSYSRSGTTWFDLSFSGYNGTLTNGPSFSGSNGGSIFFDGTNDNILMSSTGVTISSGTNPWSTSFWVNMSTPSYNQTNYTILGNTANTVPNWFSIEWLNYFTVNSIDVDSSGKIYVGGEFYGTSGSTSRKFLRFNSNGTLDTTFKSEGLGNLAGAQSVEKIIVSRYPSTSDKIYVGGSFTEYSYDSTGVTVYRLIRLNNDGTLDNTFNIGTGFNSTVYDIVEDSSGNLYIGGAFTTFSGQSNNNKIIKLNSSGQKISSFNTGLGFRLGTATTSSSAYILSLALSPDETKLYVGGVFTTYDSSTVNANRLARLNTSDGSLDNTFDMTTGADATVTSIKLSTNGLYVGGSFTSILGSSINRIARITTGGTIDNTFNVGTGFNSVVNTIAEDINKDIYVGGGFTTFTGATNRRIVRLNSDGSKDTSFNNQGTNGFENSVNTIFVDNSNSIIYTGGLFTTYSGSSVLRFCKLSNTGTLDTSFYNNFGGISQGYSNLSTNYYYTTTGGTATVANNYFTGSGSAYEYYDYVINNFFNRWLFFTLTMSSGGTITLHHYGIFDDYNTYSISLTASNRGLSFTRIGAYATATNPIRGNMSQILCYNRELSTGEVQQIYNNTKSRYGL